MQTRVSLHRHLFLVLFLQLVMSYFDVLVVFYLITFCFLCFKSLLFVSLIRDREVMDTDENGVRRTWEEQREGTIICY